MDIKLLRAFLCIAELGHFGRAASMLCITQPALSKQMLALEAELGARLFERGRHGAVLTPFGEQLLPDALQLVGNADTVLARVRQASQGERGRLDIGFGLSTLALAPQCIATFRQQCPDVVITLNDLSSAEQTRRLLAGQLDLGFVRLPASAGLATLPLLDEQLALAVPAASPHGQLPAELASLNASGFVALNRQRGPGLAAQIELWCGASAFTPRIIQHADDIQTVLAVVAAGIGVALLPHRSDHLLRGGVRLLPIDAATARWQVGLAWLPGRTHPALDRFVAMMRERAG
ncbi:Hca operon transcriptional activator HcaR [Andreprevotia sp. IGB-42]|uniref:LysR family transcriptional regulator n=1 Tax=Andreprevotia sp. IGB-42 TaxID=2497473 RepID=UPI0013577D79|nr:LysR family transcriptional regulator [Andreprevotia sp. IGB-42]KAF0815222.1 Hca operon transcriptional activator HcaR [Andreprevotia sp. IGB-42]